jgi:hypothetical protein
MFLSLGFGANRSATTLNFLASNSLLYWQFFVNLVELRHSRSALGGIPPGKSRYVLKKYDRI